MVNHKFLLIQSINLWWWEVGDPVSQNRSISPLQQNSQATPEVVDRLALFLSRVPGKRRAKFLDLPLPHTVPPTKSFCCQREESHTLPPAQLLCTTQLLVILDWQSMTMFKSINRVLLCLIQLLTEGVNLSVSQIFAMKLRFPLRQAGVDSDLVQNIWVIIWWVGARGPTRLGISEFTQIFWVFPVYIADFWQTFWVIWENGSNWSNLRLRISVSALGRLKNHNIPHLRPNFTMFTK